jgi:exonuclease VII small subunit
MAESYDEGLRKIAKPPDAEERLQQILADLNSEAASLEAEARDYEDRMLLCRARAAGLRTGASGVSAALERFQEEMAQRSEFMAHRDGKDVPQMGPTHHGMKRGYPDGG